MKKFKCKFGCGYSSNNKSHVKRHENNMSCFPKEEKAKQIEDIPPRNLLTFAKYCGKDEKV